MREKMLINDHLFNDSHIVHHDMTAKFIDCITLYPQSLKCTTHLLLKIEHDNNSAHAIMISGFGFLSSLPSFKFLLFY